jgi:hypothetical protein
MKELAERIQIVINTLEMLNIPATFHNVNRLTGVYNTLIKVRDKLAVTKGEATDEQDAEAE